MKRDINGEKKKKKNPKSDWMGLGIQKKEKKMEWNKIDTIQ
jgi:hypothetical protein